MRTEAILSRCLHILDNVLAGTKVDKGVGAELVAHLPLLLATINGNCPQAHDLCILLSKGTEATTSAHNCDGLAWACSRLLQALVDGDTSAENWCHGREIDILVQTGDVRCFGNGVLLEGTIDGVAGEERLLAELMI